MNSQRVIFKWLAMVIATTMLLQSALILPSASAQGEHAPTAVVEEEGLRLAQNWGGYYLDVTADWVVQKTSNVSTSTLATFHSSPIADWESISRNFVGSITYTVSPAETGPNSWVSFQLAGIKTAGSDKAGYMRANFYVDIVSPSGLPVTCDSRTGGFLTATCI